MRTVLVILGLIALSLTLAAAGFWLEPDQLAQGPWFDPSGYQLAQGPWFDPSGYQLAQGPWFDPNGFEPGGDQVA